MSERIHEIRLTVFERPEVEVSARERFEVEPSDDPVRITLGDSVHWKVLFDEDDGNPSLEGPRIEIRFTDPERPSGPFAGLYDEDGTILGRTAERVGRDFHYHVFLEGREEPMAWTTGRQFGGLDVGGPPRSP